MTPARDPASIDRNALVGVGELLSPRWPSQMKEDGNIEGFESVKGQDWAEDKEDPDNDGRGSPWTIEAIDGEPDEFEVPYLHISYITSETNSNHKQYPPPPSKTVLRQPATTRRFLQHRCTHGCVLVRWPPHIWTTRTWPKPNRLTRPAHCQPTLSRPSPLP